MLVPKGAGGHKFEFTLVTNAQKKTLFAEMQQTGFE